MSYYVIPNACVGYTARKGLEGPFNFDGRVLYYDPIEGMYYDPKTDFFVDQEEMNQLHDRLLNRLQAA